MIKNFTRKIVKKLLYGNRTDCEHYVNHLKKIGVEIGNGTVFYDPVSNVIDEQNPRLLHFGNNVRITHGVIILTHDYSWSVLAGKYGEILGGVAPTYIGNNVFIGTNAIITKGCVIGDNVIIGAGSVVTHNCDNDSIYAGVPAKKIMSLEEFYKKKKNSLVNDLQNIVTNIATNDENQIYSYLREYTPLFIDYKNVQVQQLMKDTGYYDKCMEYYTSHEREYSDFILLISSLNMNQD